VRSSFKTTPRAMAFPYRSNRPSPARASSGGGGARTRSTTAALWPAKRSWFAYELQPCRRLGAGRSGTRRMIPYSRRACFNTPSTQILHKLFSAEPPAPDVPAPTLSAVGVMYDGRNLHTAVTPKCDNCVGPTRDDSPAGLQR